MRGKIGKMIETDYQLQKLFMTPNPQRIEFFEAEPPEPATRKTSASRRTSIGSAVRQPPQESIQRTSFTAVKKLGGHYCQ
jgi:hypothetical protein